MVNTSVCLDHVDEVFFAWTFAWTCVQEGEDGYLPTLYMRDTGLLDSSHAIVHAVGTLYTYKSMLHNASNAPLQYSQGSSSHNMQCHPSATSKPTNSAAREPLERAQNRSVSRSRSKRHRAQKSILHRCFTSRFVCSATHSGSSKSGVYQESYRPGLPPTVASSLESCEP